ncbi:MAG: Holliday junction branch migration protein RuvA [Clostridia bacterium]|jgi:Holliday junction DNA helicase RuvA|nr:Holliday junction branch migration protein RuvA [Clostridia bacterium]MDD3232449.1 Holliday junction branch migration protein RuvA [Clostridia bacterium]MDD3862248.1 Holliday junction branch migration protein RuvA [Clostridia bacterium]MDD4408377.1 Holliday junction branch migration protein RuvA [Clostridia bacterium]
MIAFIKGIIKSKQDGKILLETSAGIGYEIAVSNNTFISIGNEDENCCVYTHMQVRDDGVNLYGFSSIEEKNLFNLLTSVSGIGPKLAMAILSGMKLSEIIISIAEEDFDSLSKIKGLGKKTAERLILELKEKVIPLGASAAVFEEMYSRPISNAVEDAIQALLSLGLTRNESIKLARANAEKDMTAEEIVQQCLKNMRK